MWVWVNSGSWWWTGRSGMLRIMGSQRVGHDWATELNWTEDVSNSLQIHGLQCARLPCPSLSPRVCSYSCRLSQMQLSNHLILHCHFLLLPSIFPSIWIFSNELTLSIRWPSTAVSASASVLPMNIQDWFPSGLTGWISLQSKGHKSLLHSSKASILQHSALLMVQLSHPYITTGKIIASTRWTFVGKVISLLFNMLSRLVVTFLPRASVF